ncbi:hypothetical protein AVEN_231659-1, partial [Araneus ventricosus]
DTLRQQARCVYSAALDCETAFIPEAYRNVGSVEYMCGKKDNLSVAKKYNKMFTATFASKIEGPELRTSPSSISEDESSIKSFFSFMRETISSSLVTSDVMKS